MDLDVHRAIQLLALNRTAKKLGDNSLMSTFHPMWLGSWLTDMNQASSFFDVLEKNYKDPYSVWDHGTYKCADAIKNHAAEWTGLFAKLWGHEWDTIVKWPAFEQLSKSAAAPHTIDDIGGYYPYDHFDVVDRIDKTGKDLDAWEFEESDKTGMTRTAKDGVFNQCLYWQLHPVFSEPLDNRRLPGNLRLIGYATHTLQDFFGHSNFIELLLQVFSKEGALNKELSEALQLERIGTYAAYHSEKDPVNTPIMTGRFDRIDTVASMLKIYERGLTARWDDLAAGGFHGRHGETRDLMLEILFGTFTRDPFSSIALETAKKIGQFQDFFQNLGDSVVKGTIKFFAWVAQLFSSSEIDQQIDDVKGLLLAASTAEAKDYAKAGKILYLIHVIEKKLREELANGPKPQLPHHTLLTKDRDEGQPEVRLAFKLACNFAIDVTTEILTRYFRGGKFEEVENVLGQVYRHPREFLSVDSFKEKLNAAVTELYGVRWWIWANKDTNRLMLG